jgi:hypothetical protein
VEVRLITTRDVLDVVEEDVRNGRIAPHLAAFIAAEILEIDMTGTGYLDWEEQNVIT